MLIILFVSCLALAVLFLFSFLVYFTIVVLEFKKEFEVFLIEVDLILTFIHFLVEVFGHINRNHVVSYEGVKLELNLFPLPYRLLLRCQRLIEQCIVFEELETDEVKVFVDKGCCVLKHLIIASFFNLALSWRQENDEQNVQKQNQTAEDPDGIRYILLVLESRWFVISLGEESNQYDIHDKQD